jgi:hypothetical protein
MKSELRLCPHKVLPDTRIIEVWHNGQMIATVAGTDGPGVRIISKHPLITSKEPVPLNVVSVMVLSGISGKG